MLCLLLPAAVLLATQQQGNALAPLPGVNEYEVVYPQKLYARHRRDTGAKYPDEVQYGFTVQGEDVAMHLERNENLFSPNFTLTYYSPDGEEITISPPIADHCYYHGYIRNEADSEASISTCNGVRGFFTTQGQRYLIEPLSLDEGDGHAVYKYESLDSTPKTCGVTNTTYEGGTKTSRSATSVQKQAFLLAKKFVKLYIVADNSMFIKYDQSVDIAQNRIFETINYVNLVYKAINTFVGLIGIDIWSDKDQIDMNTSAGVDLDRFSTWRTAVLLKKKYHDNAQLLTNIDFDGPTVGLAFVGTMCSADHSTGVIQDHSKSSISVGATIAHEMGHNLGMNHDTSSCTCEDSSCIMAASLSYVTPKLFSTCSHQQFSDYILTKLPLCMKGMPSISSLIAPAVCGNGFTESGEQCDCGLPEECHNLCCDAATCKLKPEAKCADGECCENCQIKKAGIVCRRTKDDCDIPENCDGVNAICPTNKFRVNGYPCRNGQGQCYNGTCPTLQSQCADIWGASAVEGSSQCFRANTQGKFYGFCSYVEKSFIACTMANVQCGKLYCRGGADGTSITANIVKIMDCKALVTATGIIDSMGMVLNGTACGEGKVCDNGQCVSWIQAYPRAANCSSKCKGHAVCDHENNCQCEEGWAAPDCDNASEKNIVIIIVIVILIAVTILIVIGLLWYRGIFKHKDQSSQPNTVSGVTNQGYQAKHPQVLVHTPEMSSADGWHQQTRVGYSSPQFVVASPSPEPNRAHHESTVKSFKPTTAPPPPPVPVSKPAKSGAMPKPPPLPMAKPVPPPAPQQALKPPTSRPKV